MPVNYASPLTPDSYICSRCGASGIKLWRAYQSLTPSLLCAACAAKEEGKDISTLDAEGYREGKYGGRTDQIGWYVPAVPDEEGVGYWGYSSVPDAGVLWWKRLPNKA